MLYFEYITYLRNVSKMSESSVHWVFCERVHMRIPAFIFPSVLFIAYAFLYLGYFKIVLFSWLEDFSDVVFIV